MTHIRYVLVGSGVAAIAAAQSIRAQDDQAEIHIISDEPDGYYSRPGLAYFITGELSQKQIFPFKDKDFHQLGVIRHTDTVLAVKPATQQVTLARLGDLVYDRLLLATGSQALRLSCPGSEAQGIIKFDTLADAKNILHLAKRKGHAVVVGDGLISLEIVEGLAAQGMFVHYILRSERFWMNVLDDVEAGIIEERLKKMGVTLYHQAEVAEILNNGKVVSGVRLKDGRQIACSLLGAAVGVQPRTELAESCGVKTGRGFLVDECMRTNVEHIYAAGDAAEVVDSASGRSYLYSQWYPAREQGKIAGVNMAGGCTQYRKTTPFSVTRLTDIQTAIMGSVGWEHLEDAHELARGEDEAWRLVTNALPARVRHDINRSRILVGEKNLVGAVVMGDQTLSHPLFRYIDQKIDITPIRQALLEPEADVLQILSDYWHKEVMHDARTPSLE